MFPCSRPRHAFLFPSFHCPLVDFLLLWEINPVIFLTSVRSLYGGLPSIVSYWRESVASPSPLLTSALLLPQLHHNHLLGSFSIFCSPTSRSLCPLERETKGVRSSPRLVGRGEAGVEYVVSGDEAASKTLIITLKREEKEQGNRIAPVWYRGKEGMEMRKGR